MVVAFYVLAASQRLLCASLYSFALYCYVRDVPPIHSRFVLSSKVTLQTCPPCVAKENHAHSPPVRKEIANFAQNMGTAVKNAA